MLITLVYCVLYITDYHKSFGAIELIINVVWCIFWLSAAACGAHLVDETSGWTNTMFNFAAVGLTNEEAGKIADIVAKVEVYNNKPPSIGRKLLAGRALLAADYQREDLQVACAFAWLSWFLWVASTWYAYKDCKVPGQGMNFLERWIPRDVIGHKIATIGASASFTVKGSSGQSMKKGGSFVSNGDYSPQRSSGSHISVSLGSYPVGEHKSTRASSHSRSPSRSPNRSPTKRSQSIPPEMGGMMPEVSASQAVRASSSSQHMQQSQSRSQHPSAAQQPSRSRSSSQHRSSSNSAPRQPRPEGASPSRSPSRRSQQMTQEEYEMYMARKRSQQQQQLQQQQHQQQPGQHRSSSSSGHRRPSSSSPTKRATEGGEVSRSGSRSPSKRAEGDVRRSSGERVVRSSSSQRVQK